MKKNQIKWKTKKEISLTVSRIETGMLFLIFLVIESLEEAHLANLLHSSGENY